MAARPTWRREDADHGYGRPDLPRGKNEDAVGGDRLRELLVCELESHDVSPSGSAVAALPATTTSSARP
jgi:hypothetical protein